MFFAYVILRPFAGTLQAPQRLQLWGGVFKRFFPWVWMAALLLPFTGYWLIFNFFGGFASSPGYVHIMHLLGLIMIAIFIFLYYRPYQSFKRDLAAEDWPAAGGALNRVRQLVLINLVLGIVLLVCVYAGRYGVF